MSIPDKTIPRFALSVPEFARSLGISERHARDLVAEEAVRTVKSGRRVLVPISAIEEYLSREAA